MDAAQIVRVTNRGDEPFSDRYDGRGFVIPALGDAHVPLGAVVVWLGNPSTYGAERQREVESLQARYGLNPREVDWAAGLPELEVYDQTTDDRIYFPADDPFGQEGHAPFGATAAPSVIDMAAQLADLQKRMAQAEKGDHATDTRPVAAKKKAPAKSKSDAALASIPEDDGGSKTPVSR